MQNDLFADKRESTLYDSEFAFEALGAILCGMGRLSVRPPSLQVPSSPDGLGGYALLLDGYWQSEKYFLDAKEQLLLDFRLRDGSWVASDPLARQIGAEANSIFLHVRSYKEVPRKSDGRCAIDMRDYYRNALRYLRERMGNGTVFVFSDDLGWSRRHVLTDDVLKDSPFNFVFDSANSSQLRDFTLMRMCKHGIVADSSFSWWAGWLGEQDRLSRGEEALRLHVNRRVMNDDFWPDRWIAISPSSLG